MEGAPSVPFIIFYETEIITECVKNLEVGKGSIQTNGFLLSWTPPSATVNLYEIRYKSEEIGVNQVINVNATSDSMSKMRECHPHNLYRSMLILFICSLLGNHKVR